MGKHPHPTRNDSGLRAIGRQAIRGGGLGLLVGVLLIGVGVARAALLLLTGGQLSAISSDDLRLAVYYVGGFGIAGAVLGALLPRLRGNLATHALFAGAGMIVMVAIMASGTGGLRAHDRVDWWFLLPLGAAFGLAFGYGWNKRP